MKKTEHCQTPKVHRDFIILSTRAVDPSKLKKILFA